MSDDLNKVAEELREAWEGELKPRIDQMEAESKSHGEATAETKALIDRVQDRMDEIEAKAQKAALAPQHVAGEPSQERKDFIRFIRERQVSEDSTLWASDLAGQGPKIDPDTGLKVLAIRDETLGGVLAPADYIAEVIKGVVQFSPIREIANVRQTSRTAIKAPKRTGLFTAAWTGETQDRTETSGLKFGLEEIPTHELYARVEVSNWDLEDPVIDLEADVRDNMSEQFGVAEGIALVSGNGVAKPEGFLNHTDVATVNNGATTFTQAVGANGLINLKFELKEQYWPNATFVLNRFTLREIRKLKDSNGNYIWAPGLGPGLAVAGNLPATILDSPYVIAKDMPDVASAAKTVAYGDFKKAYWIADRIEIATLRDPYTAAHEGAVILHARKRVGGQVVLPEALKFLVMT